MSRLLYCLALPLLLAACDPLFRATFEEDPLGQPPLVNPPGPPPGDAVELQGGSAGSIEITSEMLEGDRALRIDADTSDMARAIFRTDGGGNPDRPIVVLLTGRLTPGSRGELNVSSGGPQFAVQITLEEGAITANGRAVGTYVEGGRHRMILTLFPNTDRFTLNFSGQVITGDGIEGPINSPADFPAASYAVLVEAVSEGSVYIVDNITIGSRNF